MSFNLENWTGNLNYWTGGLQGCRGLWGWCAGPTFIPIPGNLTWAQNQPELMKTNKNCMHMRIHKNDSSTALSDRNCLDKYIYACKVVLKIHLKLFLKNFEYQARSLKTEVSNNEAALPVQCATDVNKGFSENIFISLFFS